MTSWSEIAFSQVTPASCFLQEKMSEEDLKSKALNEQSSEHE
jgi:hypothetical protein